MNRRNFVAASVGASLASGLPASASAAEGGGKADVGAPPQLLELRRYRLRFGPMEARFAEYQKNVLLPALNRAGVKPVGAWSVSVGPDNPAVYTLLPHPNADSVAALAARIADDAEYRRGAAAFRGLPASDPPYVRRESSLMAAFESVPTVEAPAGPQAVPIADLRAAHLREPQRGRGPEEDRDVREGGGDRDLPPCSVSTPCSSPAT